MKTMLVAFTMVLITFSFNNAEAKRRYGHSAAAYANHCLSLDYDPGPLGTQVVGNSCNYPVTFSFCATYADLKIYSCRKKSFGSQQVKANSQTNMLRFDGGPSLYACKATHIPRVNKSTMAYTCMGYDDASADKVGPANKVRPANKEVTDSAVEPSNEEYCQDVFRELMEKSNAKSTEGLENAIRGGAPSSCSGYVDDFASRVWYKQPNADTATTNEDTQATEEKTKTINEADCESQGKEFIRIAIIRIKKALSLGQHPEDDVFFNPAHKIYQSCLEDSTTRAKIVKFVCNHGRYTCEENMNRVKYGSND